MLSRPEIFRRVMAPSMDWTWQQLKLDLAGTAGCCECCLSFVSLGVVPEPVLVLGIMLATEVCAFSMLILAKTIMEPMVLQNMWTKERK